MIEEKRPRGQLIPERSRQRNLRTLLLSHYEATPLFMAALRAVLAHHKRFLSAEKRFTFEAEVNGHHLWQCRQIFEKAKASSNSSMAEKAILWAEAIWRRQENQNDPYR